MPNDREKLLRIMRSLEADYKNGKISAEKYSYFRSKYEDKLNAIDAEAATRKIRSMQGKPSTNDDKKAISSRKRGSKPTRNKRKEEQDLVQKYIINPKKGDAQYKENKPMDNGTFKLLLVLVLVIGFTAGIAYGIFNFDYDTVSDVSTVAIVEDTAFPEVNEILSLNTTDDDQDLNDTETEEVEEVVVEETVVEESEPSQQDTPSQQSDTPTPSQDTGGGNTPAPSQDTGGDAPAADAGG